MAITQFWSSEQSGGSEVDLTVLDYDDAVQTVGITCTNGQPGQPAAGHGILELYDNTGASPVLITKVNTDQFNDGQRHILAGPGASGTDMSGKVLPTSPVPSSVVADVHPPKGTKATAIVNLNWNSLTP